MSNINKILGTEIRRLARKEVRAETRTLRKTCAELRKTCAALKRRTLKIESENRKLCLLAAKCSKAEVTESAEAPAGRLTAKTAKSLRAKLGLSQEDFGKLVGVSGQTIYQWERKGGKVSFRNKVKAKLLELRGVGRREAKARLEALGASAPAKKAAKSAKPGKNAKKANAKKARGRKGKGAKA